MKMDSSTALETFIVVVLVVADISHLTLYKASGANAFGGHRPTT